VSVTAHRLEIVSVEADCVTLEVDCSAGFYVRSLAHDLGERLAVGAHLASLRRTRTGDFTSAQAIAFDAAERDPLRTAAAVIALPDMLPSLPAATLTAEGVRRAINGCQLGPADMRKGLGIGDWGLASPDQSPIPNRQSPLVRLLDPSGALVGIARPSRTPGLLHPAVVLM
jgi:tRNA U55 pseudouridine synthase TruB